MDEAPRLPTAPPGLKAKHIRPDRGWRRYASPISIVLLGGIMLAALFNLFGGGPVLTRQVLTPDAVLKVSTPEIIRNGEFFETLVIIEARRPIVEPVLSVSSSLWREVSINFMAPAASEEEFKDGAFRFIYGAMKTGDRLLVKVDGQINPALIGELRGQIAVSDGDRPLAALPLKIWVLP